VRRGNRAVLASVVVAVACASRQTPGRPVPSRAWTGTLLYAQQAAAAGRYKDADSALSAFGTRHPDTREAAESEFWRALFELDPRNEHHSTADALRALSSYSTFPAPRDRDVEVDVLSRTAVALTALREATAQVASLADSARTEADSVRTEADSARLARASRDRTREEVQRLRDSLDKVVAELTETNQELDRIKKRLTAPKP
jgi:hypothetical protein